ncbi:Uncharacterized conserved protein [Corynebacterium kutscheri]|uniref:Lipid/polyisoprenoid-binding YceI-like domain-containing protein n=1 Tax=Corynebacterium kutscheri TaxID=35755 RepID=A0A0F6TDJ8_9CORY|nr:YceI family protein [Corynebacterium kutscheri]AKE41669.1 hypothetical protein UL82_07540 [Corynebacterium kutscheri]VEH09996.1 Uncharacterized conserved protein [Corynebacterium kutscheri]VEH80075.1 Uncharacterized conserved protein [Corynebacterium kutscheri]
MSTLNGTYIIDPTHTAIGFVARHAMISKVRGNFAEFEGTFTFDAENQTASTAAVTIQTASISTGVADRDAHVRNADFFDVENYPTMTFTATEFSLNNDEGTVTGDLTIKDVTKPVTLKVEIGGIAEDPFGNTRLGFEATTKINRKDFNIDFNAPLATGGVLLSEEIKIVLDVSAIKQ